MAKYLPNLLSALRLGAAPLAAWAIFAGHDALALAVFAAAAFSDLLDGFVARRWGFVSRFGAGLDPIADKLLMLACFLALLGVGVVPFWLVALVIICDFAIVGGVALGWALSLPLDSQPLKIGKLSTLVQVVYIGACLLFLSLDIVAPGLIAAGAWLVGAFLLLSVGAYGYLFFRALFFGQRTA